MPRQIAVITGDIIDSRRIDDSQRLGKVLDDSLKRLADRHLGGYQRFRGDGFQFATADATAAMEVAVALRAALIMHGEAQRWDARLAIAIGEDDWRPGMPLADAGGLVFVASGQRLDNLDNAGLALVQVGHPEEASLTLLVRYLDELIENWSRYAAEIIHLRLWHEESQQALAKRLGIRQPSAHKRLRTARWELLGDTLAFFRSHLAKETASDE